MCGAWQQHDPCALLGLHAYLQHMHTCRRIAEPVSGHVCECVCRPALPYAHSCRHSSLQVRCKTGSVSNNGRPLRMSDLIYARPYQIKDNFGRDWPGQVTVKAFLQHYGCPTAEISALARCMSSAEACIADCVLHTVVAASG